LGGRRRRAGLGEPTVELLGGQVDVVAIALPVEVDVERYDAPVRKPLGRLREVGRRVEDDRGVGNRQIQLKRPCSPQRG
jgi:hypothetical protein